MASSRGLWCQSMDEYRFFCSQNEIFTWSETENVAMWSIHPYTHCLHHVKESIFCWPSCFLLHLEWGVRICSVHIHNSAVDSLTWLIKKTKEGSPIHCKGNSTRAFLFSACCCIPFFYLQALSAIIKCLSLVKVMICLLLPAFLWR